MLYYYLAGYSAIPDIRPNQYPVQPYIQYIDPYFFSIGPESDPNPSFKTLFNRKKISLLDFGGMPAKLLIVIIIIVQN